MELSKPGSHAWEAEEGTSGQSSRSSPLTRTLFVGFPPHGGEARDRFISQLVGACILHREERLLAHSVELSPELIASMRPPI